MIRGLLLLDIFMKNKTNNNSADIFSPQVLDSLWKLQKFILDTPDFEGVVQRTVNSILVELGYLQLGYRILVLTLIDEKTQTLKRIALSQTPEAERALKASPVPFEKIEIPLSADDNLLVRAMKEKRPFVTYSWPDIFVPVLTADQAISNQQAAGIKTSMLYPLVVKGQALGVMIFSMVKDEHQVTEGEKILIEKFTDIVGIAVQNAQLYTTVKDNAERLRQANEKLKALDKLKDEFVSLASHELRTPMTAVRSYLWMVLDEKSGELNDKQRLYLQRAFDSVDRLTKLVNDMLNISRIESGRITLNMQSVNVQQLVQDVIDEVTPRAVELGVSIVMDSPPSSDLSVNADQDKIKEVIINLVGNSLKFTSKEGKIILAFEQKEDMIQISVKDTGIGLLPKNISKLFQKFGLIQDSYSVNKSASGTGLGLYICKSIIELHGGKIWAESEGLGKGSKFTFSLKAS